MNAPGWLRFLSPIGLVLIAASCVDGRTPALGSESAPYRFAPTADGFHAEISAQGLRADLRAEGVEIASSAGGWTFHPAAARWGCDGALTDVAPATPEAEGNRATYRRRGFDEWYLHGPLGLEQGFTLPAPPACRAAGGEGVVIELEGGLDATVSGDGKGAVLHDASGQPVLRYADLSVVDAVGRELPARLVPGATGLSIRFDDTDAAYPVTVDPLMWAQQAILVAKDGAMGDGFGASVAVSGDTAVAGATGKSTKGAAYVFVQSGASWSQQAELTASDGAPGDALGTSVAVSGDTAVVGAFSGAPPHGAAYVYVRSGASWTQQAKLTANDAPGAPFGTSVAVSGDTAIVGAFGKPSDPGAAYVFVRSGASWTQQQKLTASDGVAGDEFGASVALSGDTAVVAPLPHASSPGKVYVFVRSGTSWTQQQELTASDGAAGDSFGGSLAVSGDTVVVGAAGKAMSQGAGYVFVRSGASWSQQQELTASDGAAFHQLGGSVAVSGDTAVVGESMNGAAYVFARSGTSWSQQQKLTVSDSATSGLFGFSVAVSGNTAVAGADEAAYVFVLPTTPNGTGGGGGGPGGGGGGGTTPAHGCTTSPAPASGSSAFLAATLLAVLALSLRRGRAAKVEALA